MPAGVIRTPPISQPYELPVQLGIASDVSFAGFTDHPFAYMSRAAVFVLSSAWEPPWRLQFAGSSMRRHRRMN
jgi:hypothetical protein